MWEIVEEQAALAEERDKGWSNPALIAMEFAFHTVEAYLNLVGEYLAPDVWRDERNLFSERALPRLGWETAQGDGASRAFVGRG